ncbi:uncharacterized protein A1O5_11185 [Cladophialophora psammophila CBS 110553]|uniref:Uncharacterized protein n=1 Tax=Cladophialophora psammophila CBS 110553 TaxID=1182543 RepID=W9WCH0_9EURO|nr:uncharacterized protein A1O5_11185 [Cladophialophora psammophila CBS 110553]EXJ65658.1 hypothetical protein A1O5_11185 [Cladophialophora psammophila CBS 110553]
MGNTTSSTIPSTSHSATLTSQSLTNTSSHVTISSPPITTPVIPSSLRDFTVVATDDNGNVYSEVFSGGVLISSTLVSSLPTSGAGGPWTFGSSGVSLVSRTTSSLPISVGAGGHATLTTTLRSYTAVYVRTCEGVAAFGSARCTAPWGLQTITSTPAPRDELTSHCAHWTAFTTTTSPAKAGVVNCATPVSFKASSAIPSPTVWIHGVEFSPFQMDSGPIRQFCQTLIADNIVFYEGSEFANDAPGLGRVSAGECELFHSTGNSKMGYNLTLAVAYDENGCPSASSSLRKGISMKKYGLKDCVASFLDKLANKCEVPDFRAQS